METRDEQARLILTVDGQPEKVIPMVNLMMIGRSSTCQVVLDEHEASRNHAEIRLLAGRYRISDLGSVNGTWLNGRRVTVPRDLADGDQIRIGRVNLRFETPFGAVHPDRSLAASTKLSAHTERFIVLVADIRNYTTMSEALPCSELSRIVSAWFREASDIIEDHKGVIDKFIGDAIMASWVVPEANPSNEINRSLQTATKLIALAGVFSGRLSAKFPDYTFRIGIGLNIGDAIQGNVGTGENQSFTVIGDSVNVAFRLEALTKEKMAPVIVSRNIVLSAASEYHFRDLGDVTVKGRKEPVSIWALDI